MCKKVLVVVVIVLFLVIVGCKSQPSSTGEMVRNVSDAELDQMLQQQAKETLDETKCSEIKGKSIRDLCYNDVALAKKDLTICGMLPNKSVGACIKRFASEFKDIQQCHFIKHNQYWYDLCYKEVALATDDVGLCNSTSSQKIKDSCVKGVAESLNDVELCGEISDNTLKEKCLSTIALEKNDYNICKLLAEPLRKATCYHVLANKLKDISICEHIILSDLRADCYKSI